LLGVLLAVASEPKCRQYLAFADAVIAGQDGAATVSMKFRLQNDFGRRGNPIRKALLQSIMLV